MGVMKYLILGSSGQIGSALTSYLRDQKEEVVEFDIARSPQEDLRLYPNSLLETLVQYCDFVFFLAFDVGGSVYLKAHQHSYDFISNNIKIMHSSFEVLRKFHKPFLFASSQMSNMVHSPYGLLKAIGDDYSRSLRGLVVQFWNVYGVEYDLKKTHVITDFILKAMQYRKIHMLTNGLEKRQFLYSEDACKALTILAKNYAIVSREEPLHVTNFEWTSVLNIAQLVAGHFPGTEIVSSEEKDSVQLGQRNEPHPSIRKYWEPSIGLEKGIGRMVTYYAEKLNGKREL